METINLRRTASPSSSSSSPSSSPSMSSQFRALVLDRMSSAGIRPADLARKLGCTDQNVALLLTPGRDYKLSTMEKIAAALGFRISISKK